MVVARLKADAPNLNRVDSRIPPQTAAIIERMMNRSTSLRYPTYMSMQSDIANAAREAKSYVPTTRSDAVYMEAEEDRKGFPWLPVGIGVGLLLAIAGGILAFRGGDKPPPVKPGHGGTVKPPPVTYSTGNGKKPHSVEPKIITPSMRSDALPFTTGELKDLRDGMYAYAGRNFTEGRAKLDEVIRSVPENTLGAEWARLYKGITSQIYINPGKADEEFKQVVAMKTKYDDGKVPLASPKDMAKMFLGQMKPDELIKKAKAKEAPKWYPVLVSSLLAVEHGHKNPPMVVGETVEPMSQTENRKPTWAYCLAPVMKALASDSKAVGFKIEKENRNKKQSAGPQRPGTLPANGPATVASATRRRHRQVARSKSAAKSAAQNHTNKGSSQSTAERNPGDAGYRFRSDSEKSASN